MSGARALAGQTLSVIQVPCAGAGFEVPGDVGGAVQTRPAIQLPGTGASFKVPVPVLVKLYRRFKCRVPVSVSRFRCRCRCRLDSTGNSGAGYRSWFQSAGADHVQTLPTIQVQGAGAGFKILVPVPVRPYRRFRCR